MNIAVYCEQRKGLAETLIVYSRDPFGEDGQHLLGWVGGRSGDGDFRSEFVLVERKEDGSTAAAVSHMGNLDKGRRFVRDPDGTVHETRRLKLPRVTDGMIDDIHGCVDEWGEWDGGAIRLKQEAPGEPSGNGTVVATVGPVDPGEIAELREFWGL